MALLSVADARLQVETDLIDAALQIMLDAAEQRINFSAGTIGAQSIEFDAYISGVRHGRYLWLPRKATAISAATEQSSQEGEIATLDDDDFVLDTDGRKVVRRNDGTNPQACWSNIVNFTYTPVDDTALRKRVQIDLLKIGLTFSGLQNETFGDSSASHGDSSERRIAVAMAPLFGSHGRLPIA